MRCVVAIHTFQTTETSLDEGRELPFEVRKIGRVSEDRDTSGPADCVDDIVRFSELSESDLRDIVNIQVEIVKERLLARRITLLVSDAAESALAREGFDPAFGARPLKRLIQREIGDQLAMALIEGRFVDGDTVEVGVDDQGSVTLL